MLGGALKYECVSTIEGVPYGSSEGTPTFEFEIKGLLWVTAELLLKMHLVVHLLVLKSAENDSIKNAFNIAVDDPLNSLIKGALKITPEGTCKVTLSNLNKDI